jgi:glycosyltransferase involved in cell wall biosynthesis
MNKNIFIVTFPVDLGNRTLESNLKEIFKDEADFFSFASDHAISKNIGNITFFQSVKFRILDCIKLRRILKEKVRLNKLIVFQNISPALFSYGVWNNKKSIIVLDWTRTLRAMTLGTKIKRNLFFWLHFFVLKKCSKVICFTEASFYNIKTIYKVHNNKLYKAQVPFIFDNLEAIPRRTPDLPRVVFIGGDWIRKGGDVLLNNWDNLKNYCELTIVSNEKIDYPEDIIVKKNIKFGTPEHKDIFLNNDILILPTQFDAYPQVICEASSAGLAVITTKFALGANEVVLHGQSGYISNNQQEAIDYLSLLLKDIKLIDQFKICGYNLMKEKFSIDKIKSTYKNIFEK